MLTPSDHMLVPDSRAAGGWLHHTFERDVALSREDAQFITWNTQLIRKTASTRSFPATRVARFPC